MLPRPGSLRRNQFDAERVREPACDLVLQREEVPRVAIEALRPQMRIALSIDQLSVYADPVTGPPDATFHYIAHTQLTANLPRVNPLSLVGESGVARNHQHAWEPRKISREVLGDPVCEILLLAVVAEVGKGQDDDRQ